MYLPKIVIVLSLVSSGVPDNIYSYRVYGTRNFDPYGPRSSPEWYCDHTLDVKRVGVFLDRHERISEDYQCHNFNEECVSNQTYSHTSNSTNTIGVNMVGVWAKFNELLNRVTAEYNVSFGSSASVKGSKSCKVQPGWKSWIGFQRKFLRVEGTFTKTCNHKQNGWIPSKNTLGPVNLVSTTPMKTTEDEEDGWLSCRREVIAKMYHSRMIYTPHTFDDDAEIDAVDKVIQDLINSINSRSFVQKNNENGIRIWAEGHCYNNISIAVCKACMQTLHITLFENCKYSQGCGLTVEDCKIRYEFFDFPNN